MFKKKLFRNFIFISTKSASYISLTVKREIDFFSAKNFNANVDFIQQLRDFSAKLPPAENSSVPACLILCGDQITLRTIKTPIVKGGYDEIIYWELVKMFPGKMDVYYWNYKHAGDFLEDNIKKSLFKIETVPKNFLDGIIGCLASYNIIIKKVISEETALETVATINKPDISNEPYCILNFNEDNAVFNYIENNILKYKRNIENISESISKNAMDFFKINREQLGSYISNIHLIPYSQPEHSDDKYINFSNFIKYQIKIFAEEIIKTENFLRTNYKTVSVNRVFIFGNLSNISGLDKMLANELKTGAEAVKKIEIYKTLSSSEKINNISSGLYSYPLISTQYQEELNELDIKTQHKNKIIEQAGAADTFFMKPVFQIIAALIVLSMIILPFIHKNYYKNKVSAIQDNIAQIEKCNSDISTSLEKSSYAVIDKKFKNIIDSKNYDFSAIYSFIGEALPQGVSIVSIRIGKMDDDPSSLTVISIEGWSSSPSNIPKFILNIDRTGLFQNIDLLNTRRETLRNLAFTKFEIRAALKEAHIL